MQAKVWLHADSSQLQDCRSDSHGQFVNQWFTKRGNSYDGLATNPTPGYINISGKAAQIWKLRTGELIRNLEGHSEDITAITISPNGQILATGSVDGTIRITNLGTRELIRVFKDMKETRALSFSNDSRTLAAGGTDGKIKIWQIP
ncbi:hypothetical protein A6769_38470 [Nostoc punctiforme NIES-2108]|uniref:Uncharacterized protein n=1 Tax=Nostoc punctiforme NIES-2108 TaxID=1356359 RepID=A0A367RZK9_NOSPU|nr:hypothetical protein A6769_38470 [Nostoc punctiforme NIES-2108]